MNPAKSLLALLLLVVAAGCTDSPRTPGAAPSVSAKAAASPTPSPAQAQPVSYEQQALAWGREFAKCARDHGIAGFPDPTFVGAGRALDGLDFGDTSKEDLVRAMDACPQLLQRKPAAPVEKKQPSARHLTEMRAFAKCLRDNGLTDWPDPNAADGTFPILGTRLAVFAPNSGGDAPPDWQRAWDTCFDIQTDWRMQAS